MTPEDSYISELEWKLENAAEHISNLEAEIDDLRAEIFNLESELNAIAEYVDHLPYDFWDEVHNV